jgi:hypothetical protein
MEVLCNCSLPIVIRFSLFCLDFPTNSYDYGGCLWVLAAEESLFFLPKGRKLVYFFPQEEEVRRVGSGLARGKEACRSRRWKWLHKLEFQRHGSVRPWAVRGYGWMREVTDENRVLRNFVYLIFTSKNPCALQREKKKLSNVNRKQGWDVTYLPNGVCRVSHHCRMACVVGIDAELSW